MRLASTAHPNNEALMDFCIYIKPLKMKGQGCMKSIYFGSQAGFMKWPSDE
jgi:hypothetical protein